MVIAPAKLMLLDNVSIDDRFVKFVKQPFPVKKT